jgi:hypothetical protein
MQLGVLESAAKEFKKQKWEVQEIKREKIKLATLQCEI